MWAYNRYVSLLLLRNYGDYVINNDTNKMRECGREIIELSKSADEIINEIYELITNMPTKTAEWVGPSADTFANIANSKKKQYIKLTDKLRLMGTNLVDNANAYDRAIKNIMN